MVRPSHFAIPAESEKGRIKIPSGRQKYSVCLIIKTDYITKEELGCQTLF
jgi:hypothetical protein